MVKSNVEQKISQYQCGNGVDDNLHLEIEHYVDLNGKRNMQLYLVVETM